MQIDYIREKYQPTKRSKFPLKVVAGNPSIDDIKEGCLEWNIGSFDFVVVITSRSDNIISVFLWKET